MNNKERHLKFIKEFNNINFLDILKDNNMASSGFYTLYYSLENMQKLTNILLQKIANVDSNLLDYTIILDNKEKNANFVKDLKEIGIVKICKMLKIDCGSFYAKRYSEKKYELVVNEIKKELDELYKKYSN